MQIDVNILLRGTTREIAAWRCETNQARQFLATDRYERYNSPADMWQRLALHINRLAAQNPDVQVDVFLILRGRLIENLCDIEALTDVVNYAREFTWGGNIYVAWDQNSEAAFDRLYKGNEKELEGLFRMLVQLGVTDLIELQKRRTAAGQDEKTILYECALDSAKRRARLRELVDDDGWRVILRDGAYFLADFISEFVRRELDIPEGRNRAVFYDQRPPGGWGQLLRKSRLYEPGGKLFVAALARSNPKDTRDLEELWEQESPGLKLFLFNGIFEWLYAFTRLSQSSHPPVAPAGGLSYSDIVRVESARRITPKSEMESRDLRLLVTSAFALRPAGNRYFSEFEGGGSQEVWEEEEEHCLAAAREVGGILRHLPFHVAVEIRQRVTCEQMPRLLEGRPFTAWHYIGHGDRERGLREGHTGQDASPQRWLDCFEDYGAQLRLVIFSACESAGLARLFVEAGVARVAIGFGRKVLPEATYVLSEKVMPAAFQGGGSIAAVLDAFREALRQLRRTSYQEMNKVMRYSDAKPKAFAIGLEPSWPSHS